MVFINNSLNKNKFPACGHIRKSRNTRRGTGNVLYGESETGQGNKNI
jgi:hypothetical protein